MTLRLTSQGRFASCARGRSKSFLSFLASLSLLCQAAAADVPKGTEVSLRKEPRVRVGHVWEEQPGRWPDCGFLQQDGSVFMLRDDSDMFQAAQMFCRRMILTNCTSASEIAQLCPGTCPFLELSSYSSWDGFGNRVPCGTACVPPQECGAYRPDLPFPNPKTQMCESCPSDGCEECDYVEVKTGGHDSVQLRCTRCGEGFALTHDGLCEYLLDKLLLKTYAILGFLLLCLLLVAVVLSITCNKNSEVLQRGLEHRERCLPHDVETRAASKDKKGKGGTEEIYYARAPLYPLNVNVHSRNIVGVGLALYYNHLVFVAAIAFIGWALLRFSEGLFGMQHWDTLQCGYGGSEQSESAVAGYAKRRALIALFLWLAILPASIIFARWQASAARTYDRVHTRMEDYCFGLSNLPPEATNPVDLQAWIEQRFGRPIEGVSICYDIRGKQNCLGFNTGELKERIRKKLDEHLERHEEIFVAALGVPRNRRRTLRHRMLSKLPSVQEGGSMSLFDGEVKTKEWISSFQCSGEAFVVMKQEADVELFFTLWDQPRGLQRTGSFFSFHDGSPSLENAKKSRRRDRSYLGQELEIREVTSEPTSIIWEHMGTSHGQLAARICCACIGFLSAIAIFYFVLYIPLTSSVVRYARKSGKPPSPYQTAGLGIVVGAGNNLIANLLWLGVPCLGFKRKDQADIVTFAARTLLVLLNTFISVLLTARKLAATGQPEKNMFSTAGSTLARSAELSREASLADAVLKMFLTGTFSSCIFSFCFVPLTLWQGIFLIRTGLQGSNLKGRDCERALQPDEIWLPWDYASHIQLTCCAFFPLVLAEPPGSCASRVLCAALVVWCVVMYCAQRIIHFRASKETFFTTPRLDKAVLAGWALPVSQLAVTSAGWACRAARFELVASVPICITTFLASCGLYLVLLSKALDHHQSIRYLYATKSESYKSASARLRYSYFNTNPIHVLMAQHLPDMGLSEATWYEAGKAYLQAEDPGMDARLEATRALAEQAEDTQKRPRSFLSRMVYKARVWFTGAPKHAYQALDETIQ
ncbi:hypothetical protein AK812_SmicGene30119 [Symbiodinium microadriaticum]|uniref:Uncharacterized protein n=1 Tax=Symbiodinium microadriaticum TaxID=2951 RepID=A0A1Q9D041_SYMMI|nr:hypothetical protein AK812_SmicGene30119 [Symbiodinium microadriaticum]CAE7847170.1 unnamed protein product [Symbiodinium microadriaticum]